MGQVGEWLRRLGLGELAARFDEQHIDWSVLPSLTEADLRELGLTLGQRKKLMQAIDGLGSIARVAELGLAEAPAPAPANPPAPAFVAERRQMTILFADMVGSTDAASRLDPEDMFAVVGAFQRRCTEIVRAHGGHVAQYLGDGLLAYFGFPHAGEDDAERAVLAGLELVAAIRKLKPVAELALHARVGIDTGLVVIGDLLTGGGEDDAVVGETPNLAARLQAIAPIDGVLIGAHTRHLVGNLFQLADEGRHPLKGFAAPVAVWRVLGTGASDDRFVARQGQDPGELVGREHELRLLLDRWELARDGEGQVVLLSGEPGIGKSRLVHALNAAIVAEEAHRLRYFCAPFHSQTSLYPIVEQITRAAGVSRSDEPTVQLDRLEAFLRDAGEEVATAGPLLATLCSVPTGDRYTASALSPADRKARTFELLLRQIERLARTRPLVVQVEDIHWMDPTTGELLGLLVDRARALPILVVMTARPELQPPWPLPAHVTRLHLNRIGRAQATHLMERLAGNGPLPEEVRNLILERTDGVPLFVEELTKAILESGALERGADGWALTGPLPTIRIPATLHDSLMARLDRLGPAREVALWASALGRTFTPDLLLAVVPNPHAEVEAALEKLVEAGMLYRHGLDQHDTLEFKHALVQTAAYQSLLRERRQAMHGRIAEVLEQRLGEAAPAEVLAHHLAEAALPERAFAQAMRAGDEARARYASPEAWARYQYALTLARRLAPGEPAARLEIRAILKSAAVAARSAEVDAVLAELPTARTLAERYDLSWRLAQVLYWCGRLNYVAGRFGPAAEFARQSLALADRTANAQLAAAGTNLLARIHCLRGEPLAGIAYAERNVQQMRELGDRVEEATMCGVLAFALALAGRFAEAEEVALEGVRLGDALDHLPTRAACRFFEGIVHGWRGDLARAEPAFEAALALAEDSGDVFRGYVIHGWRGEARLRAGDATGAIADLETALELGGRIGSDFHRAAYQALLAEALLADPGRGAEAERMGLQALDQAAQGEEAWSRSIALRTRAAIQFAAGTGQAEALAPLREAIALQTQLGLVPDLAWSQRLHARIQQALGHAEAAAAAAAEVDRLQRTMGHAALAAPPP